MNIELNLEIKFKAPFIVGSGFGIAGLVDSKSVRYEDGVPYIPATSIKGKIRAEYKKNMLAINGGKICNSIVNNNFSICKEEEVKNACIICRCFGSEFYDGSLIFEDGILDSKIHIILSNIIKERGITETQSIVRTGIQFNRILKTAEDQALFTYETINSSFIFTSKIYGDIELSDIDYELLKNTIRRIDHLGGNKSKGLGRCCIEVKGA
jgi:CRISPR/Cas system CSM-associated protein Csm3 (group 7 of RAMP superfamily)